MPKSNTDAAALGPAAITELFTKIGQKIEIFLRFIPMRPGFQNFRIRKNKKTQEQDGREANVDENKRECLTSLPGGNQVDGLPPASSTDAGELAARPNSDLSGKIGDFFKKVEFFLH